MIFIFFLELKKVEIINFSKKQQVLTSISIDKWIRQISLISLNFICFKFKSFKINKDHIDNFINKLVARKGSICRIAVQHNRCFSVLGYLIHNSFKNWSSVFSMRTIVLLILTHLTENIIIILIFACIG